MLNHRRIIITSALLVCGALPSCKSKRAAATGATSAAASKHSARAPTTLPEPAATGSLVTGDRVPTTLQPPTQFRIKVADLPEPFATDSARRSPDVIEPPTNATLRVPVGFEVNVFASGLSNPRWLALTPEGDVLVTETADNRIVRLRDRDGDGAAETREIFANADSGVEIPFGMAFVGPHFFLGNTHEVRRYTYKQSQGALTGKGERLVELPPGGYNQHWTRNVIPTADGKALYLSVGSRTNASEEALPRASIQRINLKTGTMKTVASGLRNPVGLAVHPKTGELHTTVNERDALGDNLVPDYFTRVRPGEFFGWPYAYLTPQYLDPRLTKDGKSLAPEWVKKTRTPDVLFQAHSAPLGLQFYTGTSFPARYHNGAFVAFRGSWNRSEGTGYKLVFIPFRDGQPVANAYEDFLTGFLVDPSGPTTWGRPVGVLIAPDGSLLFTEEANGRIYRVQYRSSLPPK